MPRGLVITYSFPPIVESGTYRVLKFVQYLRDFGWDPEVLTLDPAYSWFKGRDPNLPMFVPGDVRITRVPSLQPRADAPLEEKKIYHEIQIPDNAIGSFFHFVYRGYQILRERKVDLIFTSGPPFTLHLVGFLLKKLTGLPWVADYRDPWTLPYPLFPYRTPEGKELNEFLERSIITAADAVTCVNGLISDALQKRIGLQRVYTVPNGFDPGDFGVISRRREAGSISIVYVGKVLTWHMPYLIWLCDLCTRSNAIKTRKKISLVLAGDFQRSEDEALLKRWGDVVSNMGYVDYKDANSLMQAADLNLMLLAEEEKDYVKSKVYNQIAAGRPILIVAPPGADEYPAVQIAKRYSHTQVLELGQASADSFYEEILTVAGIPDARQHYEEFVHLYSRRELTRRLAEVFDQVADQRPVAC